MKPLFFAALAASLLTACGQAKLDGSQVIARVNADDLSVHQLNFAIERGVRTVLTPTERDELVERLIDRQLAVQGALAKGLDRRPEVMMRLEEVRRDILAAAYADDIAASVDKPADAEVAKYYADHPGLFAERKVYRLREITLAAQSPALAEAKARLQKNEDLGTVVAWLRQQPGSFTDQMALRPAEQLPIEVVGQLARAKPGQAVSFNPPRGLVIYEVQSAESAPLSWQESAPLIMNFLKKQHDTVALQEDLKRARSAAKISLNPVLASSPPKAEK
jgi:EpsD family peptidyl-prolyl cis-trans isomerase